MRYALLPYALALAAVTGCKSECSDNPFTDRTCDGDPCVAVGDEPGGETGEPVEEAICSEYLEPVFDYLSGMYADFDEVPAMRLVNVSVRYARFAPRELRAVLEACGLSPETLAASGSFGSSTM